MAIYCVAEVASASKEVTCTCICISRRTLSSVEQEDPLVLSVISSCLFPRLNFHGEILTPRSSLYLANTARLLLPARPDTTPAPSGSRVRPANTKRTPRSNIFDLLPGFQFTAGTTYFCFAFFSGTANETAGKTTSSTTDEPRPPNKPNSGSKLK